MSCSSIWIKANILSAELNYRMSWVSVGDSKIYVLRSGELHCIVREHNYRLLLNEMLSNGKLTKEQYHAEEGQAEGAETKSVEAIGEPTAPKTPTAPKDSIKATLPTEALDSLGTAISDSLAAVSDSLAAVKALAREKFVADSLKTAKMDSLRRALTADLDAEKALKKAQRDAKKAVQDSLRQARVAKKEAKWAALDAKDAEKAARKAEKNAERQRVKLKKMLKAKAKSDAREQKFFERYKARYEKKKARQDAAALRKRH